MLPTVPSRVHRGSPLKGSCKLGFVGFCAIAQGIILVVLICYMQRSPVVDRSASGGNIERSVSMDEARTVVDELTQMRIEVAETLEQVKEVATLRKAFDSSVEAMEGATKVHDGEAAQSLQDVAQMKGDLSEALRTVGDIGSLREDFAKTFESMKYMLESAASAPKQSGCQQKTVPVSLVLPCHSKHWVYVPRVLESTAKQVSLPSETIVVLTIDTSLDQYLETDAVYLHSQAVPNLRVFVRGGSNYAGANRVFGASQATNEIVSFFDCDDYMHPQRIDIIYRVFTRRPDLEAAIHTLQSTPEVNVSSILPIYNELIGDDVVDMLSPWPNEYLHAQLPSQEELKLPPWDINNKSTEVTWPGQPLWFACGKMKLGMHGQCHNGWLSVRKSVLAEVRYPVEAKQGQDSIYNYRLLRAQRNFTLIDLKLGLYIGSKAIWKDYNKVLPLIETMEGTNYAE
eukprot:GHVS01022154.1.p1 GENE.GHVS01022154.1~~GHVS01022154.1.p1  ORF type:complete len:485 (-),score=46.66 GHVS01022154.1:192-1559(-)